MGHSVLLDILSSTILYNFGKKGSEKHAIVYSKLFITNNKKQNSHIVHKIPKIHVLQFWKKYISTIVKLKKIFN